MNKGMANSPVASTGTPRTTFPREAPRTTARSEELTAKTVSQNSRPRGSDLLICEQSRLRGVRPIRWLG